MRHTSPICQLIRLSAFFAAAVLAGCDSFNPISADSAVRQQLVRVTNDATETVLVQPLEKRFSQLADWFVALPEGPEDPRLLSPGESVEIDISAIPEFDPGDDLFIGIVAQRYFREEPAFQLVGNVTRTHDELRQSAFSVRVQQSDIIVGEDYYD